MKILLVLCFILLSVSGFGQKNQINLTFTGLDHGQYIQLTSVVIKNLNKDCDTTLFWPDTVLSLNTLGIQDLSSTSNKLKVYQNIPNPVIDRTLVRVHMPETGNLQIQISDMSGKAILALNRELKKGDHQFLFVPGGRQTCIFTAVYKSEQSSIKIVADPDLPAGENFTAYIGAISSHDNSKSTDFSGKFLFSPGDDLELTGYSNSLSAVWYDAPLADRTYAFLFSSTIPTVITSGIEEISQHTANCGGTVSTEGGSGVSARGVCWSTSANPMILDDHTEDGTGPGSFISNITGLIASTTYNVRAYATNSSGTAYGGQVSFTTLSSSGGEPCPGIPSITDLRDGQVYPTVLIGTQCWLKKNMNFQTGNSWCYNDKTLSCTIYGRLYDWQTALDVCPSGWHLPSDAEWTTLTTYLRGEAVAGGKMKETGHTHWALPNYNATNSSGFTAFAGGYRNGLGDFSNMAGNAYFWSSTECSSIYAWNRFLYCNYENVSRSDDFKTYGFSVRCIRD